MKYFISNKRGIRMNCVNIKYIGEIHVTNTRFEIAIIFNIKLIVLSTCILSSHHSKKDQGWKNAFCIIYRLNMSCYDSNIYHDL